MNKLAIPVGSTTKATVPTGTLQNMEHGMEWNMESKPQCNLKRSRRSATCNWVENKYNYTVVTSFKCNYSKVNQLVEYIAQRIDWRC